MGKEEVGRKTQYSAWNKIFYKHLFYINKDNINQDDMAVVIYAVDVEIKKI